MHQCVSHAALTADDASGEMADRLVPVVDMRYWPPS
jgi:hypothetical protein